MLNHIEREVVETTKAPDSEYQQECDSECRTLEKQERRRQQTQKQKEKSLGFDPGRVRQVFHVWRIAQGRIVAVLLPHEV